MFSQYLLPVTTATLVFPAFALVLLVPFSFVAYRRRGRLGAVRSLVFFGFVYSVVAAFLLTLMPLPRHRQAVCATYPEAAHPQLVPGGFIADFTKEAYLRHGLAAVVGNPALYQVAFNVAMLVPLGAFLRYYAGRSLAATGAVALGTSLFFEATQGTGVWGLYPCPYRLADVDDLLLNTTGAALGWLLVGRLLRFLPDLHRLDERARSRRDVVVGRRVWAFTFDAVALIIATAAAGLEVGERADPAAAFVLQTIGTAVWFVGVPMLTGGATVGKKLMRITLADRSGAAPGAVALLRRYAPLLVAAALLTVVAAAEPRYVIVLAVPAGVTAVAAMLAGRRGTRLHNVCR